MSANNSYEEAADLDARLRRMLGPEPNAYLLALAQTYALLAIAKNVGRISDAVERTLQTLHEPTAAERADYDGPF